MLDTIKKYWVVVVMTFGIVSGAFAVDKHMDNKITKAEERTVLTFNRYNQNLDVREARATIKFLDARLADNTWNLKHNPQDRYLLETRAKLIRDLDYWNKELDKAMKRR